MPVRHHRCCTYLQLDRETAEEMRALFEICADSPSDVESRLLVRGCDTQVLVAPRGSDGPSALLDDAVIASSYDVRVLYRKSNNWADGVGHTC